MPGRLVHTNEVLVLLGDNWFAERTAAQAQDIAARRLQDCREQLKSAEQAAKLQSHWVEQSEKIHSEEGVDIVEEVSEEEYAKQKERHREMVRVHHQKLRQERLQQHSASAKEAAKKQRAGDAAAAAAAKDASATEQKKTFDDLMKRLDALEDMEKEEDSEQEEGSGSAQDSDDVEDDLSEETEDEETSDSDSDDDKESRPNRTAEDGEGEGEDSDDDLPADLNKFKHVKIESPMPSSDRKFQYSDTDGDEATGVEDQLGDMGEVEEVIRGRTRSFTRSVDGDHPRSDSKGRDSSSDSRTGGGGGGGGPRGQVARRVSWADQSPYIMSEDGGGGGGGIKIRYVATPKVTGDEGAGTEEGAAVAAAQGEPVVEGPALVTVIPIPPSDASPSEQMDVDPKTPSIKSPADLVRLTGEATDIGEKEPSPAPSCTPDPPVVVVTPKVGTSTTNTTSLFTKPKKSILKRAPSQDGSLADNVTGTSWLQSSESVPITNVYDHEPIVDPSSPAGGAPQLSDKNLPPAVKSRVVARDEAEPADPLTKTGDSEGSTKKMSKFKAGRLKQ